MSKLKTLVLFLAVLLAGCVSHYVVDGSCRLQIGNSTENYTVQSLSILAKDSSEVSWISDEVLPGEQSRVVEKDFVGLFKVRIRMSGEASVDTVFEQRFEGGSTFMQIREKDGAIEIVTR